MHEAISFNDVIDGENVDGEIYDIDIKRYFGVSDRDKVKEIKASLTKMKETRNV